MQEKVNEIKRLDTGMDKNKDRLYMPFRQLGCYRALVPLALCEYSSYQKHIASGAKQDANNVSFLPYLQQNDQYQGN